MRATVVGPLPIILLPFGLFLFVGADITWPQYSQQCADDAGPPYADDAEYFGDGGKYHDGSAAVPILQNGTCAPRMQKACSERPTIKTAYLEGPLDCGDQGWYCRIFQEEGWDNVALVNDYNFGHCNTTENFEDAGIDVDGHCHGSSHDNTYYWWIRDHWHRQYNGRIRCCCGWFTESATADISPEPLYNRRIANRCDYRRLVTQTENLDNCRDANEDHNMGFDDIGCDPQYKDQVGKPIPEDDGACWEISKFGFVDDDATRAPTPASAEPTINPTESPTSFPTKSPMKMQTSFPMNNPTTSPTTSPTTGPTISPTSSPMDVPTGTPISSPEEECVQKGRTRFIIKRKGKKNLKHNCNWLKKRSPNQRKNFCRKQEGTRKLPPPKEACPITCKKFTMIKCERPRSDEDSSDENEDLSDEDELSGEENEGIDGNIFIFD